MLYNLIFFGNLFLFLICYFYLGYEPYTCIYIVLISQGLLITVLEFVMPRKRHFMATKSEYFWHGFLGFLDHGLYRPFAVTYLTVVLYPIIHKAMSVYYFPSIWPSAAPFVFQVVLCLMLMTFGSYWAHRWMHTVPLLWHIHRIHHIPRKLTWMATFWMHPFHFLLMLSFSMFFPMLFSIPPEPYMVAIITTLLVGTMNHTNIKMKSTAMNLLFPSVNEHEIHHSEKMSEANSNYGVGFMFWDHIFGTFRYPDECKVEVVGVKNYPYPTDMKLGPVILKELFMPFWIEKKVTSRQKADLAKEPDTSL
jgi:sterol desaturase/sphingolipid hydroxylase (fatty acid hydroxylase superfamily)